MITPLILPGPHDYRHGAVIIILFVFFTNFFITVTQFSTGYIQITARQIFFKSFSFKATSFSLLCSKLLNDYLQAFISKPEATKQTQAMLSLREDISVREKTTVIKEIDKLEAMLKDCRENEKTFCHCYSENKH